MDIVLPSGGVMPLGILLSILLRRDMILSPRDLWESMQSAAMLSILVVIIIGLKGGWKNALKVSMFFLMGRLVVMGVGSPKIIF